MRFPRPRLLGPVLMLAALVPLSVFGVVSVPSTDGTSGQPLPPLEPIITPSLEAMDPAVRDQLAERFAALTPPPKLGDPKRWAEAYGEVGGLSFLYDFGDIAQIALANARRLDPRDFRWSYLAGVVRQTRAEFQAAEEAYKDSLGRQPNYLPALIRLGETYLDLGKPAEARQLFERALEVAPNTAAAYRGLGRAAAADGDYTQAAAHYERTLELQPAASEVRSPLAQAYRQLGRTAEAKEQLALYGQQVLVMPDRVVQELRELVTGAAVHLQRGRRARETGDPETALAEFRQAVEADPQSAAGYRALGSILRQEEDLTGAIEAFRRATELQPGRSTAYSDLAGSLVLAEQPAEAEAQARRAIEIEPELAEGHLVLGIALARQQRPAEALVAFERAAELDPQGTEPRFERAMALLALRRGEGAVNALRSVLALDPDHPSARANLGVLLEGSQPQEAREHLEAAIRLAPGPQLAARSRLSLGRIAERGGDFKAAASNYGNAIAEDSKLVPAYVRLGSVRARDGDFDGAIAAYQDLLRFAPEVTAVRMPLVSSYLLADWPEDAQEFLSESLRQAPDDSTQSYLLALILSGSRKVEVRDPGQGLILARRTYSRTPSPLFGQALAIAFAATGRFDEAVRAQQRLIADLEGKAPPAALENARKRLAAFGREEAVYEPWKDDRSLIPAPWLPLRGERP